MTSQVVMNDFRRTFENLHGLLVGFSVDGEINDVEIAKLREWLDLHKRWRDVEPFKAAHELIDRILADGVVEEHERDELLDWCGCFINESPFTTLIDDAVRRLHGVLIAIGKDNLVSQEELEGLSDWLEDYRLFEPHWPFNEVWQLIHDIDGHGFSQQAAKQALHFCQSFNQDPIEKPLIHDQRERKAMANTQSPIFKPFSELCDRDAVIIFSGRAFCFTGPARTGKREILERRVIELGGTALSRVTHGLDYLVIGAHSSPCWVYATYGRKIEKVIENRESGASTVMLHEDDFVMQASLATPNT